MLLEKKALSLEDIEAQAALELPEREMMQVNVVVVIGDVLSDNTINIEVKNNRIAVQVCALIDVINLIVGPNTEGPLTCDIQQ